MDIGKLLIAAGLVLVVLGLIVVFISRTSLPVGRLPGDIVWRGKHTTIYFPIVTCLILSAVVSLVLWLLGRR
jgi:predicted neutral ceramidase superfamily lipid hydrolase